MIRGGLALLLLAAFAAAPVVGAAQASSPVEIKALYDVGSHIPMALIPFRVQGSAMSLGKITRIRATSAAAEVECRAMRDRFRLDIVLLKCTGETDATLDIQVKTKTTQYDVTYGPVEIRPPSAGLTVVNPGGPDPNILLGKQLFQTYCVSCHSDAHAKKGRTAAQVQNAVLTVPDMKNYVISGTTKLGNVLTSGDYMKLEAYLKSLK